MATKAKEPAKQVRITAKQVQAHRERAKRDPSPSWDGSESWSGERFTAHFREAMKWYNLETNSKTLKPQIINWMAKNGYTKTQITEFKKTRDGRCVLTMGAVASCLLKGMPPVHEGFNKGRDTSQWLGSQIAAVVSAGKNDIDEEAIAAAKAKEAADAPAVPSTTIQDRVNEAARLMTAEIEDALEQFHADPESFDPKAFKILNLLRGKA